MALVVPDEEVIMKWAADNEKAGAFPQLCKSEVRERRRKKRRMAGSREAGKGELREGMEAIDLRPVCIAQLIRIKLDREHFVSPTALLIQIELVPLKSPRDVASNQFYNARAHPCHKALLLL